MTVDRSTQEALAYISSWLPFQQRHLRLPGIQYAILAESTIIASGAIGHADATRTIPLREDHFFHVASQSKMFTATALMQLREKGKLSLDDSLGKWLDWLPKSESAAISSVTIRDALSHGGGILRDGVDARYWSLERSFPTKEELKSSLGNNPAVYSASEKFKYSNIAFGLLGLVVEAASGSTYDDYVQAEIIEKLGLSNTGPDFDESRVRNFANCHSRIDPQLPQVEIEHVPANGMASATGAFGTASDLCRFASAHFFGNGELVSDASKHAMQQAHWDVLGSGGHYGLGTRIYEVGERKIVGHGGNWAGHFTSTFFDPNARIAVSVFTNAIGGPALDLTKGVFSILNFAENRSAGQVTSSEQLDRFCVRLATIWGTFDVVRFGTAFYGFDPTALDPTDYAFELAMVGDNTLRIVKNYGISSHGENMVYEFDGDKVAHVRIAGDIAWPYDVYAQRLRNLNSSSSRP